MSAESAAQLQKIYQQRFESTKAYRRKVWQVLIDAYFSRYVPRDAAVLDLGCGYGEFVNQVHASVRYAMDLNPDARAVVSEGVTFLRQDCAERWNLPADSLEVVFTSNFFEHLPSKAALSQTLEQAWRCLKMGGRLIAMGPNIRRVEGAYWDFYDHHLPLTEMSLGEAMRVAGFAIETSVASFMPYTLVGGREYPLAFVRAYLRLPLLWPLFGKQFLVIARKDEPR